MVIWVTGLSASGKTTLCNALRSLLHPRLPNLVLLDGDTVRDAFSNDLSYRESDRFIQIGRLQRLARELSHQGHVVLVAALYAHPDLLQWNRSEIENYFEVYIEAPLSLLEERDPKGLYRKAAKGEMPDVVGLDIAWHAPQNADLVIKAMQSESPERMACRVAEAAGLLAKPAADSKA